MPRKRRYNIEVPTCEVRIADSFRKPADLTRVDFHNLQCNVTTHFPQFRLRQKLKTDHPKKIKTRS
jgi:hypothetical protein